MTNSKIHMSIAAWLLFGLLFCPWEAEARTYRIGSASWMGWVPLEVAEALGLWSALGVDVKVENYDDVVMMQEALLVGTVDFCMSMGANLIWFHDHSNGVRILADVDLSHGGDMIVVKKGLEFNSLGKGEKLPVGVYARYGALHYFLHQFLKTQGRSISDVKVISLPAEDLAEQFIMGRLKSVVLFEPVVDSAIRLGGGQSVATSADYPGIIPEVISVMADKLREFPREDVVAILRGWIRAVRWLQDPANQKAFYDIINERLFFRLPDFSEEAIHGQLSRVVIHSPRELVARNRPGGIFTSYLRGAARFLYEYEMVSRKIPPREIFVPEYMMEALRLEGEHVP